MKPEAVHPRDRYLTVFGRKPVLEALENADVQLGALRLDRKAKGGVIQLIVKLAKRRKVDVSRVSTREVNRISRNARQDQGVVLDVIAHNMAPLDDWLAANPQPAMVIILDGVTTPANVGLLIRSACAAGVDGIVIPRKGCPEVGPLVIKASAGTAFMAPILRAADALTAVELIKEAGYSVYGLLGGAQSDLYQLTFPEKSAWVLGNETKGVSPEVNTLVDTGVRIPMADGIESLNVAAAGTIVAYEYRRRQSLNRAPTGA